MELKVLAAKGSATLDYLVIILDGIESQLILLEKENNSHFKIILDGIEREFRLDQLYTVL